MKRNLKFETLLKVFHDLTILKTKTLPTTLCTNHTPKHFQTGNSFIAVKKKNKISKLLFHLINHELFRIILLKTELLFPALKNQRIVKCALSSTNLLEQYIVHKKFGINS